MSDVLVIVPGHGSEWLSNAYVKDGYVIGEAWDDNGVGSALMPDDWRGEPSIENFPLSCVLRWAASPDKGEPRG